MGSCIHDTPRQRGSATCLGGLLLLTLACGGTGTPEPPPSAPVPTLASFSPATGPVGTWVTLTGTHLTGVTAVRFHGTAAATYSVLSSTQISARVPAGATTGALSVVTPQGTATSPGSFTVEVLHPVIDPHWRTHVSYIGRFDHSDALGPWSSWPGSAIRASFQGTNISLALARINVWDDDFLEVAIDDAPPFKLKVDHDGMYTLATGLSQDVHSIVVTRRNEGAYSEIQYKGFAFDDGQLLAAPARADRRIEVIGDSITCGYGNEAADQYVGFTTDTENVCLAYESIAARALGAEATIIAWSGKGMYRNYDGATYEVLPVLYPRTLAKISSISWDFSSWIPQVVVINLGTNDFAQGTPDRTTFVNAYKAFVATIRGHYPDAEICCAVGPMLGGSALTSAVEYIQVGVVQTLQGAGDAKLHFIQFPTQDGSDGYGADWHPSAARHRKMGEQLTTEIKTIMGW